MAQQHNKNEETEVQFTETLTLTLCINNCGLYGNPSTNNMCSSCFHSKIRPKSPGTKARPDPIRTGHEQQLDLNRRSAAAVEEEVEEERLRQPAAAVAKKAVNRCLKCRKRVGLTGFRCRCGDLFCGDHRYSDRHDCGFDYKATERERIQRENPLVRAAKIVRI